MRKIITWQEADGYHWDTRAGSTARGYLDARGVAYPTRKAARAAGLEAMRPLLYDYQTGEIIRSATAAELAESRAAGEAGVIVVDGRSCYVSE